MRPLLKVDDRGHNVIQRFFVSDLQWLQTANFKLGND